MQTPSLCFAEYLILSLFLFAWADYSIDDRNNTVQYSPPSMWDPQTDGSDRMYNNTFTSALCTTPQACSIEIPFTGSGITVYGFRNGDFTNFTVTLDGKMAAAPAAFSLDHNDTYNDTLYHLQGLSLAHHIFILSLFDSDSNDTEIRINFDYAAIDETASPAQDPSVASYHHHSHFPVGALVGGVVAGLAVIAIVAFTLRNFRRKRRVLDHAEIDPEQDHVPSDAEWRPSYAPEPTMPNTPLALNATSPLDPNRSPSIGSAQHNVSTRIASPSSADSFTLPVPPTSTADSTDLHPSTPFTTKSPNDGMASAQNHPSPQDSNANNQLTDGQADFVNSLYNHNVPAHVIARIVQRMMAGQEVGELVEVSTVDNNDGASQWNTTATAAPPSYTDS